MTYEEMQSKFILNDGVERNWYYCSFGKQLTKGDVVQLVLGLYQEGDVIPQDLFIHKDKQNFFIGLDVGHSLPEDFCNLVVLVDPPVPAEEEVTE